MDQQNEVTITSDRSKVKGVPIHSYKPIYPRQAAYIMVECHEKGIQVTYSNDKVRIFSNSKLEGFQSIIKESLTKHQPIPKLITRPIHAFYNNHRLVCLALQKTDTIYTYDSNMLMMVAHQYIGNIPTAKKIKIYNTQEELIYTFNNLSAMKLGGNHAIQ